MATMEPVNKSGKPIRGRCKNRNVSFRAHPDGNVFPAEDTGSTEKSEGLSVLHRACLNGQLDTIQHLVESGPGWLDSNDVQGRQPIHMVLCCRSSPHTSACLRFLLENGADVNVATDSGQTPLHLAASEGLLDCTEMLVQAGADVLARDSMGHTPLDLAHIWCRRKVARYLKSCMWKAEKNKEMEERKLVRTLYSDLVDMAKVNHLHKRTLINERMAEWANKKGFPLLKDFTPRVQVSQYHTSCLSSGHDSKITSSKPPTASRPWTIYTGLEPEKPFTEPDLRDSVTVWRDHSSRQPQYTTKWDSTPRAAPDLPLDTLERVLFPRAFPSRIVSPWDFKPQDIITVQHRGYGAGRSTSPWTEVAMHLAEVLEPGHY